MTRVELIDHLMYGLLDISRTVEAGLPFAPPDVIQRAAVSASEAVDMLVDLIEQTDQLAEAEPAEVVAAVELVFSAVFAILQVSRIADNLPGSGLH